MTELFELPDVLQDINVYVRKGAHNQERFLSFPIPPKAFVQDELLDLGVSIDGNQALWSVTGSFDQDLPGWRYWGIFQEGFSESLPGALAREQRAVAEWLKAKGFRARFA